MRPFIKQGVFPKIWVQSPERKQFVTGEYFSSKVYWETDQGTHVISCSGLLTVGSQRKNQEAGEIFPRIWIRAEVDEGSDLVLQFDERHL
jgi:hypothetical protein